MATPTATHALPGPHHTPPEPPSASETSSSSSSPSPPSSSPHPAPAARPTSPHSSSSTSPHPHPHPRPARSPKPKHPVPPKHKPRHMLCGYIVDHAWAAARARALLGLPAVPPALAGTGGDDLLAYAFLAWAVRQCALLPHTALRVARAPGGVVRCVALAENTSTAARRMPPQEQIERLKALLETDAQPRWYRCAG